MIVIGRLLQEHLGRISGFQPSHFFFETEKKAGAYEKGMKFRDVKYPRVRWPPQGTRYCQTSNILLDCVRGGSLSFKWESNLESQ